MSPIRRGLVLLSLVIAGEAVFVLPFVIPRVFRPTVLEVLQIDNTQLGAAFSLYGVVAMVSYLLGGPLADRFSTRRMMSVALFSTASGGLYYATFPSASALVGLYGAWGVSTILLFWAGLLRATREWGGPTGQGKAYGFLDGGRGLLAALLSTAAVAAFAALVPESPSDDERRMAFRVVVLGASALTTASGALIWWLVPERKLDGGPAWQPAHLLALASRPTTWLQATIVVCAYVGYKGTDDLSLLAVDVLHYSEVQGAAVGTLAFWLRPVSAVGAGLLADRIGGWRTVAISFALLILADLGVVLGTIGPGVAVLFASIVGACVGVYALRGVYFALFQESGVPVSHTGTAVGLVSFIGYTPDVFFGPMMGAILDGAPGVLCHQHLSLVLAGFATVGLAATAAFGVASRSAPAY
jgi:nitrate/nitrite transporter NarK